MVTLQLHRIQSLFLLICLIANVDAFVENLYCGKDNCYEILGVNRESTKDEIGKAYRVLAKKNHPDRFKKPEDKKEAEKTFRKIATAYETLKDDDQRADYNFMLDNPEEYYQIYWRYYRRKVTPKVDPKIIIGVCIGVFSVIQYFVLWSRYEDAMKYLMREPKYRSRALQAAMDEGIWNNDKKKSRKTKEGIKEEEDVIVRQILESKMDIKGGYAKPNIRQILILQILMLPVTLYNLVYFYVRWIWRYVIHKMDYEEDDKTFLIKRNLKFSSLQWEALEDKDRQELYQKELWISENAKVWKKEKDEKAKAELANSGKYKAYRRWMKKGGAGQITFGADE